MEHTDDYWKIGDMSVEEAARALSVTPDEGVFLHVSTSTRSLSRLNLSSEEENELLRDAWELVLLRISPPVAGKRASWRSFLFVLRVARRQAAASAQPAFHALATDPQVGKTTWQLVLGEISDDWRESLSRLESGASERPEQALLETSLVWVEGDARRPTITTLLRTG